MVGLLILGSLLASLSGCAGTHREVRVNGAPVSDTHPRKFLHGRGRPCHGLWASRSSWRAVSSWDAYDTRALIRGMLYQTGPTLSAGFAR